jgi:hypothetical protein
LQSGQGAPGRHGRDLDQPGAAGLPFIVAGALMMSDEGGGLHWLAGGVIVALAMAVWNAWVLLIEILR